MKRIFEKHGKILLTILGVVLMIVFALPTLRGTSDNSGTVVGSLNGKKIRVADLIGPGNDIAVLKELQGVAPPLDERDPRVHWMLELQEAKHYGFDSITVPDGTLDETTIAALQSKLGGLRQRDIYDALSHLMMIRELQQFIGEIPVSMSALELAADQNQSHIQVAYATLDAAKDTQNPAAPSEDQIQKQYDLYKGVVRTPLPSSNLAERPPEPKEINGHHYPFGYKYPDRVTVEYIKFDRNALRDTMQPTAADYIDAYAYYKDHPDDPAFKNTSTTPTVVQSPIKSFDEVSKDLVNKQIADRVDAQIKTMLERASMKATEPWKSSDAVPRDQWVKYQEIVADFARRPEDYKPVYKSIDKLMGAEELDNLPDIGKAKNAQQIKFSTLATHVKELIDAGVKDPLARLSLQLGVDGTLHDDLGNLYLYRVTSVEKTHEPKSLDEVKGQVISDLKLLTNFERLAKTAKELADAARKKDLMALAKEKAIPADKTVEFSQVGELPLEIKNIHDFVKQAYTLVPPGSARSSVEAVSTAAASQAATQSAGVGDTTTLLDDSALRVYALQLLSVKPESADDFGKEIQLEIHPPDLGGMRFPTTLLDAARAPVEEAFAGYLSLDNLVKRLKYVPEKPYAEQSQ